MILLCCQGRGDWVRAVVLDTLKKAAPGHLEIAVGSRVETQRGNVVESNTERKKTKTSDKVAPLGGERSANTCVSICESVY